MNLFSHLKCAVYTEMCDVMFTNKKCEGVRNFAPLDETHTDTHAVQCTRVPSACT